MPVLVVVVEVLGDIQAAQLDPLVRVVVLEQLVIQVMLRQTPM